MPSSLDDTRFPNLASIAGKKFRLCLKGYSVNDVDQFLSAVVAEVSALQSALETAEGEAARLKEQTDS